MTFLAVKNTTKIAIKILQGSAVIQNMLGGLIIHHLFATFPRCMYANKKPVLSQGNRDAAAVLFLTSLKVAMLRKSGFIQSFKHTGAKQYLTQNRHSRSFKVVHFGTNRKRVSDYLLVINSNLGSILPRLRDIAGFLLRRATPPVFHPNFRGVPLGLYIDCSEVRIP